MALDIVIAGAGVAGLEAVLALRSYAGDEARMTVLSPEEDFVYRPMRIREPFGLGPAAHYPLTRMAGELGFTLVRDGFRWLDAPNSAVHTLGGRTLDYDVLLLAMGARTKAAFPHALSIDDARIEDQLHGLLADIERGAVGSIAFVIPAPAPWPLPIYELALMTAVRAREAGAELDISLVTPEPRPLAIFGAEVSGGVSEVLGAHGISVFGSAHPVVPAPGQVITSPGHSGRTILADRIVALPALFGPSTPGVPGGARGGFIPVDSLCRVRGLQLVYAAGDATDFPIKHGGIAAQQADTAAQAIAALTGAPVVPRPFRPDLRGVLIGAGEPLYMSARFTGTFGSRSRMAGRPLSGAGAKIDARYLAPYLDSLARAAGSQGANSLPEPSGDGSRGPGGDGSQGPGGGSRPGAGGGANLGSARASTAGIPQAA